MNFTHPTPTISVVIPAHDEEKTIHIALDSLGKQTTKTPFEVIVVDNASTDRTAEVARALGARVVSEPQKGVHFARRAGVAAARGSIIASTDAETAVPQDWLERIEEFFAADQTTVALGGPYTSYDADTWGLRFFFNVVLIAGFRIDFVMNGFRHYLAASNMAFRRWAYDKVGGYHTTHFLGEDVDLSKRLNTVGRVLYIRKLVVSTSSRRYKQGFWKALYIYLMNHFEHQLGILEPRHNELTTVREEKPNYPSGISINPEVVLKTARDSKDNEKTSAKRLE